jgi:hypothetical protein
MHIPPPVVLGAAHVRGARAAMHQLTFKLVRPVVQVIPVVQVVLEMQGLLVLPEAPELQVLLLLVYPKLLPVGLAVMRVMQAMQGAVARAVLVEQKVMLVLRVTHTMFAAARFAYPVMRVTGVRVVLGAALAVMGSWVLIMV